MAGILQKMHLGHGAQTTGATNQYGYNTLPRDQKAARFEQKALAYEQQGNLVKAQKNREKALRHRQYAAPGYVRPAAPQGHYAKKLQRLEAKHATYLQRGNTSKADRTQRRILRLRQKHPELGVAAPIGMVPVGGAFPMGGVAPVGGFVGGVQHETIVKPAIVQETIRTDRIVEVQPVIHREVDQTTVHHIEKHITEAPAANRGGVVQMAPIVQETVRPHVIDEVTPVIHREIATTQVERVEEHQTQRVVAPTQHTNQVVFEQNRVAPVIHTTWTQYYGGQNYAMGPHGYPRLTRDQKAQRFEQKALRYEQQGNLAKAQKNREKALRHRQYLQPGYVAQPRPAGYYPSKLQRLQAQQQRYQQQNNTLAAQRSQARIGRLQSKHRL